MKFIREKLSLVYNKIKQSCFTYRVTMICVAAATLYGVVWYILDHIYWDAYPGVDSAMHRFLKYSDEVFRFFVLFILAVMFVESILSYDRKEIRIKITRIACFVLSAVTAALLVGMQSFSTGNSVIREWAGRYYIGCFLLLMLGIIYLTHRKSGVDFIEYMMHVLVNFCIVTTIYFVLCIGVTLVLIVFMLLFFDDADILLELCWILLTGLYYVPACIMSLGNMESNIDDEISKVLMKSVLTWMTVCAMAIVYAYLLKILITWEMPSNEIFGIVSGLFCIGMFIWVVDYYYRDDTKYTLFVQKLPYGMIPMIPVQAYAMCVRIYHNGMTPERYLGILLVVFELIVLLIWRFKRDKMESTIAVLLVCAVVAIFVPFINMFSVSNRWQKSFLVTYYNKVAAQQEITEEEYQRMEGAYKYLRWKPEMAAVVEQYDIYADDFVKMLVTNDIDTDGLTNIQHHYIHCCQLVGTINVDEYNRFDMVDQDPQYEDSDYRKEAGKSAVDFTKFRFYRRSVGEEEMFEVDISDFADKCFAYEEEYPDATQEEISDAMGAHQIIEIDDNTVLYLNHFEVRYNSGIKDGEDYFEWSTVNISGMLLSR